MSDPTPPSEHGNKWPFRIGFTLFLLLLGAGFFALMLVIAPALEELRDTETVLYKCDEVISGDTLLLIPVARAPEESDPVTVRILGIEAPPVDPERQAAFAAKIPEARRGDIPRLARAARGALSSWFFKQENLLLHYDQENPVIDERGRLVARVEISKVDVGKIQLRHGQALATDEDHIYRPQYHGYEQEAREAAYGIWSTR